ncbi:uncharacterized protein PG986_008827 [Apiospora aurea]|uniref:USP domain-containing protein n=1 Tax=Apiospora aurea TaxID=335848 RepID=A0ABR1Q5W3_9PEZI
MPGSKHSAVDLHRLRTEWPLLKDAGRSDLTGVHVLLVVIRHLFTFLDETPVNEQEPVFIRAALMLVNKKGPLHDYKNALRLKTQAVGRLLVQPGTATIDMFNSKLLNDKLWSREPFHLLQQRNWVRLLDDPLGNRQLANEAYPDEMVRLSLIQYDGTTTLSDFVNSKFGAFDVQQPDGDQQPRRRYHQLPGLRTFIRVHYKPQQQRSFREVMRITVHGQTRKSKTQKPRKLQLQFLQQTYYLVAAVRLGKQGEKDIVRTYDARGYYIQPPTNATSIIDEAPRIGADDHEWLLFYLKTDSANWPNDGRVREFIPPPVSVSHKPSDNGVRVAGATSLNHTTNNQRPSVSVPNGKDVAEEISKLTSDMADHSVWFFSNMPLKVLPSGTAQLSALPVNNAEMPRTEPTLPGSLSGLFPAGWFKRRIDNQQAGPAVPPQPVSHQPPVHQSNVGNQPATIHAPRQQLEARQSVGAPSLPATGHPQTPTGHNNTAGTREKTPHSQHDATQTRQRSQPMPSRPSGADHLNIPIGQAMKFAHGPRPPLNPLITPVQRRQLSQDPTQKSYEWLHFQYWLTWAQQNPQKAFQQLQDTTLIHFDALYAQHQNGSWVKQQQQLYKQYQQQHQQQHQRHQQQMQVLQQFVQLTHQRPGSPGPAAQPQNQSNGPAQADVDNPDQVEVQDEPDQSDEENPHKRQRTD